MHSGLSAKKLIDVLIEAYPKLTNIIPESDLPVMKNNSVQIKFGGTILGEGYYGVVTNSNDPNKVIKITTDVSEATFASTYIEKNWINDLSMTGIVRYHYCFNIGKIYKNFFRNKKEFSVYFISREATHSSKKPVNSVDTKVTDALFQTRKTKGYQYLEENMLFMDQGQIMKRLKEIKKPRLAKHILDIIEFAGLYPRAIEGLSYQTEMNDTYLSLIELMDKYNIYICDLHKENLRTASREFRNEIKLINVVSDPGHMFVMPWSDIVNPKAI